MNVLQVGSLSISAPKLSKAMMRQVAPLIDHGRAILEMPEAGFADQVRKVAAIARLLTAPETNTLVDRILFVSRVRLDGKFRSLADVEVQSAVFEDDELLPWRCAWAILSENFGEQAQRPTI